MKKIKKQILLVTSNNSEQIELTTHPGWVLVVVEPGEAAIEKVQRQGFDLVLLDKNNDSLMLRKMKAVLPLLVSETEIHEVTNVTMPELETVVNEAFEEEIRARRKVLTIMDGAQVHGFQI
jgi:DNA-binding response OmpR family regulator